MGLRFTLGLPNTLKTSPSMLHCQNWLVACRERRDAARGTTAPHRDLGFLYSSQSKAESMACQRLAQAANSDIGCFVNSCFDQTVSNRDLALNSYCETASFN